MIINLLSNPRNVSTALMYSFAQRPDTAVVDEPFYASFLHQTGKSHPGREEVLRNQPSEYQEVVNQLWEARQMNAVLFIKNMAHHHVQRPWSWMKDTQNILFIRNPARVLASFEKVIHSPSLEDIAIKYQWELMNYFIAEGTPFCIVDSKDLLQNPALFLRRLCDEVGIPFFDGMLSWPAGPKKYDGVWSEYWYAGVHESTSFTPYKEVKYTLSKSSEKVYKEALPYYLELHQRRLIL